MGGRGKYAGQPYSFVCAKCRKSSIRKVFFSTIGERVRLTGKTRKQRSQGMNYHNWGDVAYQYECLTCGHIGWTRHPDIAHRHKHEQEKGKS